MTQRILIITTKAGSQARVQIDGNGEAFSITFATMDEAWQWAKNILAVCQQHKSTELALLDDEVAWNGVL